MLVKSLITFFDRLEDKIRIRLSHHPIVYALVGAVGIVLVWKGVWETAELVPALHGWGSLVLGMAILLGSGLLVSFFIGDNVILSGFKREKKLVEKTEQEILKAERASEELAAKIDHLEKDVHQLLQQHR